MASVNGTTIIHDGNDDSTGQVLASGSQDIAALAGLFCTDGVERNALASEYGYMTVITSALSILGILGLVKSSVKLALGLQQCLTSGWSADSLRGIFGYTFKESPRSTGQVINCLRVSIYRDGDHLVLEKQRQRFDEDRVPMLDKGWNEAANEQNEPNTTVNLGNMIREREFAQSPIVIGLLTFLCSGITSWALIIVSLSEENRWHWTVYLATIGLHVSLIVMLAPALWHAHRTCRPSIYLTGATWRFLARTQIDRTLIPKRFTFMRTCKRAKNGYHQVLHFRGDVSYLEKMWFKILLVSAAGLCTASYICQYTVLKGADSTRSAIWIGLQAGLAVLRLLIWLLDPPFDDPRTHHAEYVTVSNDDFSDLSLIRILTDFMGDGRQDFLDNTRLDLEVRKLKIPFWAWNYLQQTELGTILEEAKYADSSQLPTPYPFQQDPSCSQIPVDAKTTTHTPSDAAHMALGRDRFVFETTLTRLFERHHDILRNFTEDSKLPYQHALDLRLILVLTLEPGSGKVSVAPLLALRGKSSAGNVPEEPELLSMEEQPGTNSAEVATAKHFRFAGDLKGYWFPFPTNADLDRFARDGSYDWTKFLMWFKEAPLEPNDITQIDVDYLQVAQHGIGDEALAWVKKFYEIDWFDLRPSAAADSHALLMDMRCMPLPRSWKLWNGVRSTLDPGEWYTECRRLATVHMEERWTFFEINFKSHEDCLEFVARYIDHDAEVQGLMWLKRASKMHEFVNHIPLVSSFAQRTCGWTWQNLERRMMHKLETTISDIYQLPRTSITTCSLKDPGAEAQTPRTAASIVSIVSRPD